MNVTRFACLSPCRRRFSFYNNRGRGPLRVLSPSIFVKSRLLLTFIVVFSFVVVMFVFVLDFTFYFGRVLCNIFFSLLLIIVYFCFEVTLLFFCRFLSAFIYLYCWWLLEDRHSFNYFTSLYSLSDFCLFLLSFCFCLCSNFFVISLQISICFIYLFC